MKEEIKTIQGVVVPGIWERLHARVIRLDTRKCDGNCGATGWHTAHLTLLGEWRYIHRHRVRKAVKKIFRQDR